jgi:hypothetical protein
MGSLISRTLPCKKMVVLIKWFFESNHKEWSRHAQKCSYYSNSNTKYSNRKQGIHGETMSFDLHPFQICVMIVENFRVPCGFGYDIR